MSNTSRYFFILFQVYTQIQKMSFFYIFIYVKNIPKKRCNFNIFFFVLNIYFPICRLCGQISIVYIYIGEFQPCKYRDSLLALLGVAWVVGPVIVAGQ